MSDSKTVVAMRGYPTLFGDVMERRVVFVIDTSASMHSKLSAVKDDLIEALMKHAIREGDTFFNVIQFNSNVIQWSDKLVQCTPETVQVAADWLKNIECTSTSNTLDALLAAFSDTNCEAVYLVTDSLPDQDKNKILDHVAYIGRHRPVHCIYTTTSAERCCGVEEFLEDLAGETFGSYSVVNISVTGNVEKISPVFKSSHNEKQKYDRIIRTKEGHVYPNLSKCSVTTTLAGDPLLDSVFTAPHVIRDPCSGHPIPYYHPYNYPHSWWWPHAFYSGCGFGNPQQTWSKYRPSRAFIDGKERLCGTDDMHSSPTASVMLIGRKVLVRRKEDGYFYVGLVKSEIDSNLFLVEIGPTENTSFKETEYQETSLSSLISLDDALRHIVLPGDCVLAPINDTYKAGKVIQGCEKRDCPGSGPDQPLSVSFVSGESTEVASGKAVWIPHDVFHRLDLETRMPDKARLEIEATPSYPEQSKSGYPVTESHKYPQEYQVIKPVLLPGHSMVIDHLQPHACCHLPVYPTFQYCNSNKTISAKAEDIENVTVSKELTDKVDEQIANFKVKKTTTFVDSAGADSNVEPVKEVKEVKEFTRSSELTEEEMRLLEEFELDMPEMADAAVETDGRYVRYKKRSSSGKKYPWRYWNSSTSAKIPDAVNLYPADPHPNSGWGEVLEHRLDRSRDPDPRSWTSPSFRFVDRFAKHSYDRTLLDDMMREKKDYSRVKSANLYNSRPKEFAEFLGRGDISKEERERRTDAFRRSIQISRGEELDLKRAQVQAKWEAKDNRIRAVKSAKIVQELDRERRAEEASARQRLYKASLAREIHALRSSEAAEQKRINLYEEQLARQVARNMAAREVLTRDARPQLQRVRVAPATVIQYQVSEPRINITREKTVAEYIRRQDNMSAAESRLNAQEFRDRHSHCHADIDRERLRRSMRANVSFAA